MTVRHGLIENTDVTVSLPYQPVYEFTTAYVGGIPQKVDAQQGWGSPSFRVAFGLVGDASKPYSVAVALTAVADMMGNSTGSTTPAINLPVTSLRVDSGEVAWSFMTATIVSGVALHDALAVSKTPQATAASTGARLLFPTTERNVRGPAPKSLTSP